MAARAAEFEKLGVFYLGRPYDLGRKAPGEGLLLYDSKDLTTHAVCVGMTGSGKTGLCLSLLEEAAIDGLPAIAIDPKGDLGNLLLTFPRLDPADFRPWIDESEAARRGLGPDEEAKRVAEQWRKGLAAWGQDGERIARLRSAADLAIYTPGSSAGLPLSVLRSFAAPPKAVAGDADALRERVSSAVSGLLALLGIEADPIRSREHILLSNLLDRAWSAGQDLDLAGLIRQIQSPPVEKVGVMDIESFFPSKDRSALAMSLNSLLASPGFAAWLEGEPLDVASLLHGPGGRPRISILSIAHLPDPERMFFVTLLLNEVIAWMRAQPGTSSLRALLYMDEIFGYFPPTANPPSKTPMLTLMKQARAYGLGVVLATQNPVDLDYKGLSNAGTWFLGRLQTERDKARVLEGLEGVSAGAGKRFDRAAMEATLAGLGSRIFLMQNVHEDAPVVFETRWALSYLRGPLTRAQIQTLMDPVRGTRAEAARAATAAAPPAPAAASATAGASGPSAGGGRPIVPPEVPETFLASKSGAAGAGDGTVYRPALLACSRLHYVSAKAGLDHWSAVDLLAPLPDEGTDLDWDGADRLYDGPAGSRSEPPAAGEPAKGASFAPLPACAARPKQFASWEKDLKSYLYRARRLPLWRSAELKEISRPGESETEFRVRVAQAARERRDAAVEKLRAKYASKIESLQKRIRTAEERVQREKGQVAGQGMQTAISMGATILGMLTGRKVLSVGNIGRGTTAARGAARTMREKQDVARAEAGLEDLQEKLAELEAEIEEKVNELGAAINPADLVLEEETVSPRKSDIAVAKLSLAWTPWRLASGGFAERDF